MKRAAKIFIMVISFFSLNAGASDMNSACARLATSLRGEYDAILMYPNGGTESVPMSMTQQTLSDFTLMMNDSSVPITLINGTLSQHDTCILQGKGVSLTELAIPYLYDININGVLGLINLQKRD